MKTRASQLGGRYLPFLAVAAVLCLLVVIAPSKGRTTIDAAEGGSDFTGEGFLEGSDDLLDGSDGSQDGKSTDADGTVKSGGTDGAGTGGSGAGSGTTASGGGSDGAGGPAAGGGGGGCEGDKQRSGPYPLGVSCRPDTDTNPGETMAGVTATEIRYVWYQPPSNPVVSGLLAGVGFARETEPFCDTMLAYERSAQKWFELSGRKLVALDGPGNNAGSPDCGGRYKFWQSTCPSSPDPACSRAEAKTIAEQLRPAFVLAPSAGAVLQEELAGKGVIVLSEYLGSRERFQQFAPYLWAARMGSERALGLHAEYFCKRLVGESASFGGDDVKALGRDRHVGLVYPDNGSGALQPAIDLWLRTVRGCGDTGAKVYPYQSDVSRAQQQSTNIVAQLQSDGVTTVGFCCDPISMAFFLQAMNQSRYEPEHLIVPMGSMAHDIVGQLATQLGYGNQWRHAFGISDYPVNEPDRDREYRKAYADGGGPGGAEGIPEVESQSWRVFKPMMQMIHQAGPDLNPRRVFDGMQSLPPVLPSKRTVGEDYAPPDPFTPFRDVAEIWWNPNLRSYYNDEQGSHCYINGAARYDLGQIPGQRPAPLFGKDSDCTRLEEYE